MAIEGIGRLKIVPIDELRARRETGQSATSPPADKAPASDQPTLAGLSESDRDRLLKALKAGLDALPDVRCEKIIEAKLRISSGYYERDDIRREVLRSLLASLLPPTPGRRRTLEDASEQPPLDSSRSLTRKPLERDRPLQNLVESPVHLTHTASAEELLDADPPDALARGERHGVMVHGARLQPGTMRLAP